MLSAKYRVCMHLLFCSRYGLLVWLLARFLFFSTGQVFQAILHLFLRFFCGLGSTTSENRTPRPKIVRQRLVLGRQRLKKIGPRKTPKKKRRTFQRQNRANAALFHAKVVLSSGAFLGPQAFRILIFQRFWSWLVGWLCVGHVELFKGCTRTRTRTRTRTHAHALAHAHTRTQTSTHTHTHTHTHTNVHTCTRTRPNTHTHTETQTNRFINISSIHK